MDNRSDDQLLQIVWDYMTYDDPLQQADVIIVGGCRNLDLAYYAAELHQTAFAPVIVFSGHQQPSMDITEADLLADTARKAGVPESAIIRETMASNTGENIVFSARLLHEKGIDPKKVILIHQPFMSRRFLATAQVHWPGEKPLFITRHPQASLTEYSIKYGRGEIIRRVLGNFGRMASYAKKGYQAHHDIPDGVTKAYKTMLWRGHRTG